MKQNLKAILIFWCVYFITLTISGLVLAILNHLTEFNNMALIYLCIGLTMFFPSWRVFTND